MKNFGGIKTRYLLDGTNIIAQEVTNGDSLDYIYFFYDASGSPVGMNYLGYNYYYKKNLQGDIIEIWGTEDGTDNHTFRRLVEYTYDAWGNILQMNDTTDGWFKVGTANPFRYRGYYYDNESGLYYPSNKILRRRNRSIYQRRRLYVHRAGTFRKQYVRILFE